MTDKLIERMARAICMATAERTGVPSKKRWVDERWKDNKSCAAAALAAHEQYLKENGLVIVQRETVRLNAVKQADKESANNANTVGNRYIVETCRQ